MTTQQKINGLWQELRTAINRAYEASQINHSNRFLDDAQCLRDYAENISWNDDLSALLARETANERQHRTNRPSVHGFSAITAAKLILMENVSKGAQMAELPKATAFLVLRHTAVEAEVIGFLISSQLSPEWHKAVKSFDYAALMKA
jgi:hypothetical protein